MHMHSARAAHVHYAPHHEMACRAGRASPPRAAVLCPSSEAVRGGPWYRADTTSADIESVLTRDSQSVTIQWRVNAVTRQFGGVTILRRDTL